MQAISAYREMAVSTQTKGRLVVLLYDGAIKFLRQALTALERQDFATKGQYINKAQAIITELNSVLDMERGGQIADNLRKLYNFMSRHLNEANMQRDPAKVRQVIGLLEELNEGWKAVTA